MNDITIRVCAELIDAGVNAYQHAHVWKIILVLMALFELVGYSITIYYLMVPRRIADELRASVAIEIEMEKWKMWRMVKL